MDTSRRRLSPRHCGFRIGLVAAIGLIFCGLPLRAARAEGRLQSRLLAVQAEAAFGSNESAPTQFAAQSESAPSDSSPAVKTVAIESSSLKPQASNPSDSCGCCQPRPCDQIWLVSTRELGCACCEAGDPALQFFRYDGANGWQSASLQDFLATDDPKIPTDFYIHGNFVTSDEARNQGLAVYHQLVACVPCDRPIRMVVWSWPTDPGHHKLQLLRNHACRADTDAWYLAWLLNRIDPRVKIGLVGYSFGARVATGAMHLLGGGELIGKQLPRDEKETARPTVRGVLLAAAEDSDWLDPGAPNGEAIPLADSLLLLNNGCDKALKLYPHMDRCSRATALGYVGLRIDVPPKVEQEDVCCQVGKKHEWSRYFYNQSLVERMRPFLFLEPTPVQPNMEAAIKVPHPI